MVSAYYLPALYVAIAIVENAHHEIQPLENPYCSVPSCCSANSDDFGAKSDYPHDFSTARLIESVKGVSIRLNVDFLYRLMITIRE